MSSVKEVFITSEVAAMLGLTSTYLIKLAKSMELTDDEMREAGTRNYLFSEEGVAKLRARNKQK